MLPLSWGCSAATLGRSRAHKDGFRVQPALRNVVQQPIEAAMGVVQVGKWKIQNRTSSEDDAARCTLHTAHCTAGDDRPSSATGPTLLVCLSHPTAPWGFRRALVVLAICLTHPGDGIGDGPSRLQPHRPRHRYLHPHMRPGGTYRDIRLPFFSSPRLSSSSSSSSSCPPVTAPWLLTPTTLAWRLSSPRVT